MEQRDCARLETQGGRLVMLKGVKVTGELRGLLFEASVEQRFCNSTDKNVEVIYTFPLPWGAVLLGVDVLLGDEHLTGAVVEKKQAEACYEEALSEGNAAIMLEKNRDRSYSLNLGNLIVQEDCVITLRYAQILQFEQRGLRLLIPTVIAPRYGDAVIDGGLQPHLATHHDLLAEYPFDIELQLYGELVNARVSSPSHPIGVALRTVGAGRVMDVTLARRGALDRDFVLVLDQLAHNSVAVITRDGVEPDSVVALVSFCPRILIGEPSHVAVKILVDCSGSMNGDSIDAARRSLQSIVQQLGKGDRFSLSRFGDTVKHRSRGLWSATEATKVAAQRWIGGLQANLGGTEMNGALISTFALAQTVPSDVLIVTDGEIEAIDRTIKSAKDSGHRLFVVGIGSSPAESHLRRLAEETGGACDFVAPGEAVEPAVLRMFTRLRSPRLSKLSLVCPADVKPVWVSPAPSTVFDGDTVHAFFLLKTVPAGPVRLTGVRTSGDAPEEIACVEFSTIVEPGDTLSRVAASLRLRTTRFNGLDGIEQSPMQLAVAYQLVTDQTNFLLIHERAEEEKPTDMPDLHKVAQMLPAGWGGTGSVSYSIPAVVRKSAKAVNDHSGPAVFCRKSRGSVQAALDASRADKYLIPAFLRKHSDIDRADPRYSDDSANYTGLTPFGMSDWLRIKPRTVWPKSYGELRQIGLGAGVVDWLELTMASQSGTPIPERTVVEAFTCLMSQQDIYDVLAKPLGLLHSFREMAKRLKNLISGKDKADNTPVDIRLVDEMLLALEGMTTEAWPDAVLALETFAEESA